MSAPSTTLIRATDVTKNFRSGALTTEVLFGVSLKVYAGELTLVMGPSGSGKTTLISILAGLLRPTTGTVDMCGSPISTLPEAAVARVRRAHLGFVFQSFNLFPALSARDNVAEILAMKGTPLPEAREQANDALRRVGLAHRIHHLPGALSGGEKQRIAVARAIAGTPSLVIGDEPTAALDAVSAAAVIELLRDQVGLGTGVLLVTHDRRLERFAHRVLELEDGRLRRIASFAGDASFEQPS